jgi:primary-amine oxidase
MLTVHPYRRVVYFNLGTHHIPHSGDIPNTLMTTASSSVMLVPHNFHDRDPSRAAVQGVSLKMKSKEDGGGSDVKYYGAKYKGGIKVDLVSLS